MTIDRLDGHDGFIPAKGHIGCPLFPAIFSIGSEMDIKGELLLSTLLMGYEFGARLHSTTFPSAPDITVKEADTYWADLGRRWYMGEKYYKPYPICRWAQAPVEGERNLM